MSRKTRIAEIRCRHAGRDEDRVEIDLLGRLTVVGLRQTTEPVPTADFASCGGQRDVAGARTVT